jgi:ABC-type phosphate/phosphonate transport system ATPase subunit
MSHIACIFAVLGGNFMPLVEVRNLVKRYTPDGPNAVDDVSFDIHAGEMFSLLGPNGAGKTTAISMIPPAIAYVRRGDGGRPQHAKVADGCVRRVIASCRRNWRSTTT